MRIFLTGATGYVGSAVARRLAREHDVLALVRSDASARAVTAIGVTPVHGDITQPETFADAEVMMHVAAMDGPQRVEIDRAAAQAMLGMKPRLFVYTSVMFVLGDVDGADEDTAPNPPAWIAERARTETMMRDAGACVIRPGMVYGGDAGGAVNELLRTNMIIGDGENRWPLVHRDDVAGLYALVIENDARGIFHAVDDEPKRVNELAPHATHIALEDARAELGAFADALCLDQVVRAPRSKALGWRPRAFAV
ncbi:MAG TPA: NAD-dependent epimerase/dehydratase family protein [Thermoanaerobaculia bacterium]|nr:NAD-dependent epimerase/dehydratase family protein [Thermoanaerobaculia bacterium]